jgi:hypothetical protein
VIRKIIALVRNITRDFSFDKRGIKGGREDTQEGGREDAENGTMSGGANGRLKNRV